MHIFFFCWLKKKTAYKFLPPETDTEGASARNSSRDEDGGLHTCAPHPRVYKGQGPAKEGLSPRRVLILWAELASGWGDGGLQVPRECTLIQHLESREKKK